jgi:hypothetical protein
MSTETKTADRQVRRILCHLGRGSLLFILASAAYVGIPAVTRTLENAQSIQEQHGEQAFEEHIVDFAGNLGAQVLATKKTVLSGYAVNYSRSSEVLLSDDVMKALANPTPRDDVGLIVGCTGGMASVSLSVRTVQLGRTLEDADHIGIWLLDGQSRFRPSTPFIIRDELDLLELNGKTSVTHVQPKPLWHIPYIGPVRGVPERRAELVRLFPQIAEVEDCKTRAEPTVTMAEIFKRLELDGPLANWQKQGVELPSHVTLNSTELSPWTVITSTVLDSRVLSITWTGSGADAREQGFKAFQTLSQELAKDLALDSDRWRYRHGGDEAPNHLRTYALRDGKVSLHISVQGDKTTLTLDWNVKES